MATKIKIGHASTDSASAAANEVLIVENYDIVNGAYAIKHNFVLRPKTRELAEKSAAACEAGCKNNKIEYSQSSRNTLNTEAKKVDYDLSKITTTCYADCSSFMTVCAIAGGAAISYSSGAPNCGTMKKRFKQSGDYIVLTASTYLNGTDYLQRGDILVRETYLNGSRHTVMVLSNGSKVPTSIIEEETTTVLDRMDAYTAVKIALNLTNITATATNISAKITKIKNGKETSLSKSALKQYTWRYKLESLDTAKTLTEKLQVGAAPYKFYIDNLIPSHAYKLSVFATEKDSEAVFISPDVIFITASASVADNPQIDFSDASSTLSKCKLFVKIKDAFKRAILYR